ncbi:DUF2262 domain-containing protein [uncultured Cardiobacterium sp.]|uniref:DUF2262 domain-containing protein n=1 Tax=uncultured Cardiobacterium sp. TaxID=417619 RepID=UPI00261D7585|nr:DUF2262 domain-containing protein [uncultured Cardiobacterium sp.]
MNTREQQERAVFTALYRDEAREIAILSSEGCEGAGRAGKALIWSANCDILAYKDGGQLHHEEGSVSWPANDAELNSDDRPRFRDLTLYRLRVCPHKTAPHDFLLLDILAADVADSDLETIRAAYRQPVIWQEAPFASFTLDKNFHTYNGEGDWPGQTIRFALDGDDEQARPTAAAIATLRRLTAAPQAWHDRLTAHAAHALLDTARAWQADAENGDPGLSEAAFTRRIRLEEITIGEDGSFTAWFNDDSIFWGHVITVSIGADGAYEDADIAG